MQREQSVRLGSLAAQAERRGYTTDILPCTGDTSFEKWSRPQREARIASEATLARATWLLKQ